MINHELPWSTMNYHGHKPWCHLPKHGLKQWTDMVVHGRPWYFMVHHGKSWVLAMFCWMAPWFWPWSILAWVMSSINVQSLRKIQHELSEKQAYECILDRWWQQWWRRHQWWWQWLCSQCSQMEGGADALSHACTHPRMTGKHYLSHQCFWVGEGEKYDKEILSDLNL